MKHGFKLDKLDGTLSATLVNFKSLRAKETCKSPAMEDMSLLMCDIARKMKVACHNHLVLNFGKRLLQFVSLKYDKGKGVAFYRSVLPQGQ